MTSFVDLQNQVLDNTHRLAHRTAVKAMVNDAYHEIHARLEMYEKTSVQTLTVNVNEYDLVTAFSITDLNAIRWLDYQPLGQINSFTLERVSPAEILDLRRAGSITGYLYQYAIRGASTVMLYPTPIGADTLTIYYSADAPDLVNDADVPVAIPLGFHDTIVLGGSARAARMNYPSLAAQYEQQFEGALARLRGFWDKRKGAAPVRMQPGYGAATRRPPHDRSAYWSGGN